MNGDRAAGVLASRQPGGSPSERRSRVDLAGAAALEDPGIEIALVAPRSEAPGQPSLAIGELLECSSRLEAEGEQIGIAVGERIGSGWPLGLAFGEEAPGEALRESLAAMFEFFRSGAMPLACPEADASTAVLAAKLGSLKTLHHGYRSLEIGVWRSWLSIVEEGEFNPETRDGLLRHGLEFFSRYFEAMRDFVTDVFQAAIEHRAGDKDERRLEAVRAVLEAEPNAAEQLGVELEAHHLGLLAEGADGPAAARGLAKALGRAILLVGPVGGSWWGWISGVRPLEGAGERALRSFEPPEESSLAIGLEGFGAEGFRSTHGQAIKARAVAPVGGGRLSYFGDVAVAALALASPEDARAFVVHELRGIDQETSSDQRIRETILAYFAAGHNAACAAAALGVHQQTVTNRLAAAEERLGRSVASRRVELETALRLRALLVVSG